MIRAEYLKDICDLDYRKVSLDEAVEALAPHVGEFDCIVVVASASGMFGAMLADRLNKHLVIIRKLGVSTHSENERIELPCGCDTFLFVDDLVDSGHTRNFVLEIAAKYNLIHFGDYMYYGGILKLTGETLVVSLSAC